MGYRQERSAGRWTALCHTSLGPLRSGDSMGSIRQGLSVEFLFPCASDGPCVIKNV